MRNREFKRRVAKAFEDLLPFYRTLSVQSRFLDRDVVAFAPAHCGRAVDIGCGYGELCLELAGQCGEVVGIDLSEAMIADAEARLRQSGKANVTLVRGDCDILPGSFQNVDYVVCVRSIHYLDIEELLARIRATVRKGARVLIVGVSRKYHRHPTVNLLLEMCFYLAHPGVAWRFVRRFGLGMFWRIHRLKYRMDRNQLWSRYIDKFVFDGTLKSFADYAELYPRLLPGCSIDRVTVREFMVKWEKAN